MKLILCKKCSDVFKLDREWRDCKCGECSGKYLNDLDAIYSGEYAVPIGFANSTLVDAIKNQPMRGMGKEFTAFVIPTICPTMKKKCQ